MSELTVEQIIKLVVGVLVVVAVVLGIYLIFKEKIFEFFNGIPTNVSLGNFWRSFYD